MELVERPKRKKPTPCAQGRGMKNHPRRLGHLAVQAARCAITASAVIAIT
jgi:hypothetical protein